MKSYQVVGIGNAVVDVISSCEDHFLSEQGIHKGAMQLVDRARAEALYQIMERRIQTPGGSVANTISGLGALGVETAFIGRVHGDDLGRFYIDAMVEDGIDFVNHPVSQGELPTSRSMIFVSADGERSMNTYLGISSDLSPTDVPDGVAGNTRIMFLEGYLFDKDKGKQAFRKAAQLTKKGGGRVGIGLSDPFCVDRHREDFLTLIENDLDYVIGNEAEIRSLYPTKDLESALDKIADICPLVVCTRSGDGVILRSERKRIEIPVEKIVPVDATGAGDQFAAGFLFGLASNRDLETCARIGCVCAAEVIRHVGPRPETRLLDLLKAEGLV